MNSDTSISPASELHEDEEVCSSSLLSILDDKNRIIAALKDQVANQKLQLDHYMKQKLSNNRVERYSRNCSGEIAYENMAINLEISSFCKKTGMKTRITKIHEGMTNVFEKLAGLLKVQEKVLQLILGRMILTSGDGGMKVDPKYVKKYPAQFSLFYSLFQVNGQLYRELNNIRNCCTKLISIEDERTAIAEEVCSLPCDKRCLFKNLITTKDEKFRLERELELLLRRHPKKKQLADSNEAERVSVANLTNILKRINEDAVKLLTSSFGPKCENLQELEQLKIQNKVLRKQVKKLKELVKGKVMPLEDERKVNVGLQTVDADIEPKIWRFEKNQLKNKMQILTVERDTYKQRYEAEKNRGDYFRKDESRRDDSRRDDHRQDDSRRDVFKKGDYKRDDSKKDEFRIDGSRKNDSKRDDSRRDECRKDRNKRDELKIIELKDEVKRLKATLEKYKLKVQTLKIVEENYQKLIQENDLLKDIEVAKDNKICDMKDSYNELVQKLKTQGDLAVFLQKQVKNLMVIIYVMNKTASPNHNDSAFLKRVREYGDNLDGLSNEIKSLQFINAPGNLGLLEHLKNMNSRGQQYRAEDEQMMGRIDQKRGEVQSNSGKSLSTRSTPALETVKKFTCSQSVKIKTSRVKSETFDDVSDDLKSNKSRISLSDDKSKFGGDAIPMLRLPSCQSVSETTTAHSKDNLDLMFKAKLLKRDSKSKQRKASSTTPSLDKLAQSSFKFPLKLTDRAILCQLSRDNGSANTEDITPTTTFCDKCEKHQKKRKKSEIPKTPLEMLLDDSVFSSHLLSISNENLLSKLESLKTPFEDLSPEDVNLPKTIRSIYNQFFSNHSLNSKPEER